MRRRPLRTPYCRPSTGHSLTRHAGGHTFSNLPRWNKICPEENCFTSSQLTWLHRCGKRPRERAAAGAWWHIHCSRTARPRRCAAVAARRYCVLAADVTPATDLWTGYYVITHHTTSLKCLPHHVSNDGTNGQTFISRMGFSSDHYPSSPTNNPQNSKPELVVKYCLEYYKLADQVTTTLMTNYYIW